MKARESRQKVVLNSRLRCGGAWSDACILNVSARGLGLQAASPPMCGTYIEVRRGNITIVARVVWVKGQRFGARTQDKISAAVLIGDRKRGDGPVADIEPMLETRALVRAIPDVHARNRASGRIIEFCFIAILAVSAASAAAGIISSAIGHPIAAIEVAMS